MSISLWECIKVLSALFHKFGDVFVTLYFKIYSLQDDTIFYTVLVVNDTPLWSPLDRGDEKGPPYQRGIEGVVNNEWCRSFA